jgi:HlyD family secretion protein
VERRARASAVAIGRRNDEQAEVRGGLAVGDVVVRFPSERIRDGVRVRSRGY